MPADQRVDDEYLVEGFATGHQFTLNLVGGLVTGLLHPLPGKKITPTGAYHETNTTILAIDLSRVRPSPSPTASSPTSATWFDVTAQPSGATNDTHLKAIVGVPHAAAAPASAPMATVSSATGNLFHGSYQYGLTYAHANGNETDLGPLSSATVLMHDSGAMQLSAIPAGPAPPATHPEHAVVARRIYRQGPSGGDPVLVGQLPGPGAPHPPAPLPTTFTDTGAPIDLGDGTSIGAGLFRAPSRLRVRYTAEAALNLRGSVVLVEAGTGSTAVDTYGGSVTAAPTQVEVVQDDRTALRGDLHLAKVERSRLRWSANSRAPGLTVQLLGLAVDPFDPGVDVRVDDAPKVFGFDWRLGGDLLTVIDVRGQDDLAVIADPAPPPEPVAPTPSGWPPCGSAPGIRPRCGRPARPPSEPS